MSKAESASVVCGIVMPISHADDDHTADHWKHVLEFVKEAVANAGLVPQPVWEKGDYDVIQAKILKNLFENEIVVVDVSTNNPNVMLELGMRLTTKKPTIIIAEEGTKLPFDTGIIHTDFYDPKLSYGSIREFVKILETKLTEKLEAARNGTHKPYLQHFEFETVQPTTVSLPVDVAIADRLEEVLLRVIKLDARLSSAIPSRRSSDASSRIADVLLDNALASNVSAATSGGHKNFLNDVLSALDESALKDRGVGARVRHAKYGDGTVVHAAGGRLEIQFDKAGTKTVMSSFVEPIQEGA